MSLRLSHYIIKVIDNYITIMIVVMSAMNKGHHWFLSITILMNIYRIYKKPDLNFSVVISFLSISDFPLYELVH